MTAKTRNLNNTFLKLESYCNIYYEQQLKTINVFSSVIL